jgi:small multidrug resistance pump
LSAFYFLTFAIKEIPLSVVYATWSGLGIFTIAIFGYVFYKQTLSWPAVLGLFLIVIGITLVNVFSSKIV